jgi:hypothetical protein
MSRVVEKRFDAAAGAVIVTIEDDLGVRSVHTIHVLEPDGREADVEGYLAARLREAEERAAKVKAAFAKHGWIPPSPDTSGPGGTES